MSDKRKDSKGRNLKAGESQRSNGQYIYQYKDADGKRKVVYSWKLVPSDKTPTGKRNDKSLREKEKEIQRNLDDGIYTNSKTVLEIVEKYISLKIDSVKVGTHKNYDYVMGILLNDQLGTMKIQDVKLSTAKLWVKKLSTQQGKSYNTIQGIKGVIQPAFQLAVDDDLIRKNPFDFALADCVRNDAQKRTALESDAIQTFLDFLLTREKWHYLYYVCVILLNTGLRISEFTGLTLRDIDFKNKSISVGKQLMRNTQGVSYISSPKSAAGNRIIPLNSDACEAFQNLIKIRDTPAVECMIDGYGGFLTLDRKGKPRLQIQYTSQINYIVKIYNENHQIQLPKISPHLLRHTFCTNMAMSGMNPKKLQYLMGHSDISITLNTYTHVDYKDVSSEFFKICKAQESVSGNLHQTHV